ncbi:hypothetical protein JCM17823_05870 [Halorubrum gandharaense]
MDKDTLRRALEDGGLTSYQTDAYLALLSRGMASATEVAQAASVPSSQIYDVLRSLEKQGYVETLEQDTLHARPTDPAEVLEEIRERGERLVEAADEIEKRWQRPSLSEHHMTVFKRAETVLDRSREQVREADTAIEIACRPDQFEALADELADARNRGVVVKLSLYCDGDPRDVVDADLREHATEVRACYIPGPFLSIVDRTRTCYAPNERASEPFGLVFNDYILSFVFHWYFQSCHWLAWETVVGRHDLPMSYVNIQGFIHDAAPLFLSGATFEVTVEGRHLDTDEYFRKSGTVVDMTYQGRYRLEEPSLEDLAGETAILFEADGDRFMAGGWGAVYEDIEARLIHVEGITFPLDTGG